MDPVVDYLNVELSLKVQKLKLVRSLLEKMKTKMVRKIMRKMQAMRMTPTMKRYLATRENKRKRKTMKMLML